ncbi:15855_t:CDS:2, partial [Dentiscutata heterogama]
MEKDDFRKLNNVTKKDTYPLPRIDDMLNNLGNAQWFTSLDLTSGYWQVEVKKKDKEKTAFITKYGLYEFNVMPFG